MGSDMSIEEIDSMPINAAIHADPVGDTDPYIGQVIRKTGQILGVEDPLFGNPAYLIDGGNGEYHLLYDENVTYDEHLNIPYASLYGTAAGLQIVTLKSGGTVTVAAFNAENIMMAGAPLI